ncbi:MAG: DUF1080 domain-containing protein [Planctomycetes bacterium]|nr:DUF1080 domain-containing protein [Planctomycetota bacterium]
MDRLGATALTVLVLMGAAAAGEAEEGFKPLFDGKTLDGWNGDPDLWKVEDGAIAGSTDEKQIKSNNFLATTKPYKNFVLKLQFKLRNGNSGVQVRSKQHPDYRVTGYQPDIAESRYTGILYEEGGRGILADVDPKKVAEVVKKGDWNQYVITCDGPKIKIELNGTTTVDYTEKDEKKGATEGIIAFQLHVGPKMKIWFKDVEIKELP